MATSSLRAATRAWRSPGRGREAAPGRDGWRRTPRAAGNAERRAPTPACVTAADQAAVELLVALWLLCKPGQGVLVGPRWAASGWAYAVGRYARERAPGKWNSGACGVDAASDDWESRVAAIFSLLETKLPDGVEFEIAPWFVSGGRVMFMLTARAAIAPRWQRAAGVKRHGGKASRASRSARRAAESALAPAPAPADAPADAGIEELEVPSPVAGVATGVAAAPAAASPADAPAAEVARLSQTPQVSPPSLPLLALFHAVSKLIPELIPGAVHVAGILANWVSKPGKHSRSSDEESSMSSGVDDGKRSRRA
jgi:hypothetical protein